MWPGQQPPGGEPNPQDPNSNPYQQPGYQQPNPYQQPGYQQQPGYPQQPGHQQPNPYQQPTVPQYAVPGQVGGPGGPGGPDPSQDKKRTKMVAIVAVSAVVVAAAATAFFVTQGDDESTTVADDSKASASKEPKTKPSAPDNPRDGSDVGKPTIAGWKVVTNPAHGTQFDVPADWAVAGSGVSTFFEDEKKGDGSPVVGMSAPAHYKDKWCTVDSDKDGTGENYGLGSVGTKGGKGAKSTDEAAYNEAGNWVWAGYAQTEPKGTVKITKAKPYTTKSGLTGSVSTATALGVKKENRCETDGKSIAFSFKDTKGDFKSWVLHASTGVKEEVPEATIQQILSTVRLAK